MRWPWQSKPVAEKKAELAKEMTAHTKRTLEVIPGGVERRKSRRSDPVPRPDWHTADGQARLAQHQATTDDRPPAA